MASIINATTTNGVAISADNSGILQLATNSGTTAVTIDASQNVGIGTASPAVKLHVSGASVTNPAGQAGAYLNAILYDTSAGAINVGGGLGFQGNDGVNSGVIFSTINGSKENATSGNYAGYLGFNTRANGGSLTERMRIDSSGNVGIGTTSPAISGVITAVNVKSTSSSGPAVVVAQSNDGACSVGLMGGNSTSDNPAITWQKNLRFGTVTDLAIGGFTERMRIDSSGNLLVGATTTGGSATNQIKNVSGVYSSANSNGFITLLNATATTIFTMANISAGQTWIVTANVDGQTSTAYHCVFIVTADNTSTQAVQLVKGVLSNITVSGLNVQYTQSSGGTQTNGSWSAIRIC